MRLKSNFDVSAYSAMNQVILNALKNYGMIMADNGSSLYLSGAPDDRWDNNDLHALGQVPQITSFTASANSISAGTPVTLSWLVSGASYVIVSPDAGAVRSTSITVAPAQSTIYTLYATNAYGRTSATVSITVH